MNTEPSFSPGLIQLQGKFSASLVESYFVYTKERHKTLIRRFRPDLEVFPRSRKNYVLDMVNFSQLGGKF